jgi:hypothetical protein
MDLARDGGIIPRKADIRKKPLLVSTGVFAGRSISRSIIEVYHAVPVNYLTG